MQGKFFFNLFIFKKKMSRTKIQVKYYTSRNFPRSTSKQLWAL